MSTRLCNTNKKNLQLPCGRQCYQNNLTSCATQQDIRLFGKVIFFKYITVPVCVHLHGYICFSTSNKSHLHQDISPPARTYYSPAGRDTLQPQGTHICSQCIQKLDIQWQWNMEEVYLQHPGSTSPTGCPNVQPHMSAMFLNNNKCHQLIKPIAQTH